MKLRVLIRIAVVCSVVSLCLGVGVYSYFKLYTADSKRDFNLYTLVPGTSVAVFETTRLAEWLEDIDHLQSSRERVYLHVSALFANLKKNYRGWMSDAPHGLSRQMNQMLLSFHEPDNPMNQVLYCSLGRDDHQLVRQVVEKCTAGSFPPKTTTYRGRKLRIYPLNDGNFLAAYVTDDFLALSFQKRLLEEVIDTQLDGKSLLEDADFRAMHSHRQEHVDATLYVRMEEVPVGRDGDTLRTTLCMGSWTEFDLKLSERKVYCSGVSPLAANDSTLSLAQALSVQQPVGGFSGDCLPENTFCYKQWALSDRKALFGFMEWQAYAGGMVSEEVRRSDAEWLSLLDETVSGSATTCLFYAGEGEEARSCSVLSLPLQDAATAGRRLHALLYAAAQGERTDGAHEDFPDYTRFPHARGHRLYSLPRNTLFFQLAGVGDSTLHTRAVIYRDALLLSSDAYSLCAYMDALESGRVMEEDASYQELVGSLAPTHAFMMVVDMGELLQHSERYVRLVPHFFFRHARFFRHFMMAVQYTFADGVVYPNVVLLYK